MRLRHRPESFDWHGDNWDFHRIADGPTLACLDRFTDQQQPWLLHSGRTITPTGAEVRDIILQVHEIVVVMPGASSADVVETEKPAGNEPTKPIDPVALDAATDEVLAVEVELALQQDAAKPDDVELFPPAISQIDKDRAANARLLHKDDDLPTAGAQISDWEAGEGVGNVEAAAVPAPTSTVPESIAALIEPGETLAEARRRLTEILNIELAELVLARGTNKENLEREAEIQHLRNLLARIGEA